MTSADGTLPNDPVETRLEAERARLAAMGAGPSRLTRSQRWRLAWFLGSVVLLALRLLSERDSASSMAVDATPDVVADVFGTPLPIPDDCTLESNGTHLYCGTDDVMWKTPAQGAGPVEELIGGYARGGKIRVVSRMDLPCTSLGSPASCTFLHLASDGHPDGFAHHALLANGNMVVCFSSERPLPRLCSDLIHPGPGD